MNLPFPSSWTVRDTRQNTVQCVFNWVGVDGNAELSSIGLKKRDRQTIEDTDRERKAEKQAMQNAE